MVDLVFVYGSLKRGYYGHHKMGDAAFAGTVSSAKPLYQMLACPWPDAPFEAYPGLIMRDETDIAAGFISGEVYEASPALLDNLDEFEVVGRDYTREIMDLADGRKAWVYLSINLEGQNAKAEHERIGFDNSSKTYTWLNKIDEA